MTFQNAKNKSLENKFKSFSINEKLKFWILYLKVGLKHGLGLDGKANSERNINLAWRTKTYQ